MITAGMFRVGRDAELRCLPSGEAVMNVALAASYGKKDAEGNQATQWIEGALYGKRAESLNQYITKGTALFVCLEDVHIETYPKKDGTEGAKLVGRIQQIQFAGSKGDGSAAPRPAPAPQPARPQAKPSNTGTGFDGMNDDIPF